MNKIYKVYQVSDSTGETLDRIFLAIKAQFSNFECKTIHYSFTRTENQIDKIISQSRTEKNIIILYTIVDNKLSKYMAEEAKKNNIPSFEVLGSLISDFSKLLKQEASRKPSGQHILDELENSKKLFKKYNWPVIDVTRKSVEETAASIIKTLDILNSR